MEQSFIYDASKKPCETKWSEITPRTLIRLRSREEVESLSLEDSESLDILFKYKGNKSFPAGEGLYNQIKHGYRYIFRKLSVKSPSGFSFNYSLPLGCFEICKNTPKKPKSYVDGYFIKIAEEDKKTKIMQEMINKVDFDKLSKLFNIANNHSKVKISIIRKYLKHWARSKYEFYLMLGHNLKKEKDIDIMADDVEFSSKIRDLTSMYSQYRDILDYISISEYKNNLIVDVFSLILRVFYDKMTRINYKFFYMMPVLNMFDFTNFQNNTLPTNAVFKYYFKNEASCTLEEFFKKMYPEAFEDIIELRNIIKLCKTKTMKVSKFLSKVLKDENFDIALSRVFQERKVQGKLCVSIDPIDYLLMSINKNKWSSCQNILEGCYKAAPFSYILDETTLISYIHNNKIYNYDKIQYRVASIGQVSSMDTMNVMNFYRDSFENISFQSRELVYIDKNTCGCAFSLGYCNMCKETYASIRYFVETIISEYLQKPNTWNVISLRNNFEKNEIRELNTKYNINTDKHSLVYVDPIQAIIYPSSNDKVVYTTCFKPGSRYIYCLVCGKPIGLDASSVRCKGGH